MSDVNENPNQDDTQDVEPVRPAEDNDKSFDPDADNKSEDDADFDAEEENPKA